MNRVRRAFLDAAEHRAIRERGEQMASGGYAALVELHAVDTVTWQ